MTGDAASSMAKIELHYFKNNCFLKDNEILKNVHKLKDIPTKKIIPNIIPSNQLFKAKAIPTPKTSPTAIGGKFLLSSFTYCAETFSIAVIVNFVSLP